MRGALAALFFAMALGTTALVPSALAQEGTERFSSVETRRLSAELADTERRAVELERAIDASYYGDVGGSGEERRRLQEEQQAAKYRAAALRQDLAQARLEAIRDAPLAGSVDERLEGAETKYDALEALKGWTSNEVGLGSDEYVAVDEERMAMDDRVAEFEDEASSEERAQSEGPRQEEPVQGKEPAAAPASGSVEGDSGGINLFPALLLLGVLGGGAYYAVRRLGSGGKRRAPGTPLAPRPAAAYGAKTGSQSPPPAASSDPSPPPPRTPPPDPDPGPFDAAPPRPDGPASEDPPDGGRRRQDVPPPEDDDENPGMCPSCGAGVGPQALFCRGCGHRIRGG